MTKLEELKVAMDAANADANDARIASFNATYAANAVAYAAAAAYYRELEKQNDEA